MVKTFLKFAKRYPNQIWIAFLIIITLTAFWPVFQFQFINFDDNIFISDNPNIKNGMTWESIKWAFSADLTYDSPNADFWIPATFLSHLLTVQIFGMDPSGHHLVNLFIHIANTVLAFWVLFRMTRSRWPSAFVAVLFAIHPLHVESVVWITERKDVLSSLFFFLTLWAYLRYTEHPSLPRYVWVILSFAIGLMAKPMLITLPFLLLLLDFWPLSRISSNSSSYKYDLNIYKRLIFEKTPLFILTTLSMIITYLAVRREGAIAPLEDYSLAPRMGNTVMAYMSYIRKMVWPSDLSIFYPHSWDSLPLWEVVGSSLLFLLITSLVLGWMFKKPYIFVGWFWYVGTLVPVIGLVTAGEAAIADRYTYLPMIGLFIIVAWGASDLVGKSEKRKVLLSCLAGIVLPIMFIWTWVQVHHWKNSITLFEHAIRVTDRNYIAHNNLGAAYLDEGHRIEALQHFQSAVDFKPNFDLAYFNMGNVYTEMGQIEEGIQAYQKALDIKPDSTRTHYNLALGYSALEMWDRATHEFKEAIRTDPTIAEAYNNLGNIYFIQGSFMLALENYQTSLKHNPTNVETIYNLGLVYQQLDRLEEARKQYEKALQINPNLESAQRALMGL